MHRPPLQGPPANPIVRLLMLVGGIIVLAASLFVGAIMFLVILGLAIMMSVVFMIRVWWIRRRLIRAWQAQQRQAPQQDGAPFSSSRPGGGQGPRRGSIIEGEYEIERERTREE